MPHSIVPDLPALPVLGRLRIRHITGFNGYAVGEDGTVYSCRIGGPKSRGIIGAWKRLKVSLAAVPGRSERRAIVGIYADAKVSTKAVSRLVLEAFVGPCPEGMEACHNNGDPEDNRVDNLRWDTHRNNILDTIRHGTSTRGARNGNSKLTEEMVRRARSWRDRGMTGREIAHLLSINETYLRDILAGRRWSHV